MIILKPMKTNTTMQHVATIMDTSNVNVNTTKEQKYKYTCQSLHSSAYAYYTNNYDLKS